MDYQPIWKIGALVKNYRNGAKRVDETGLRRTANAFSKLSGEERNAKKNNEIETAR